MTKSKLFFDHIPKTAGTSLQRFFSDAFGAENVTETVQGLKLGQALAQYRHKKVLMGHFTFFKGDVLPPEYFMATVLRNPIDRALSQYYFMANDVPVYQLRLVDEPIKRLPIEEVLADSYQPARALFCNVQATHLASWLSVSPLSLSEQELYETAVRALGLYDLVGRTEELGRFASSILSLFAIEREIGLGRVNATSARKKTGAIPDSAIKFLQERNQVDLEIWKSVAAGKKAKSIRRAAVERSDACADSIDGQRTDDAGESHRDGAIEFIGAKLERPTPSLPEILSGEPVQLRVAFRCNADTDSVTIGYSIECDSGLLAFGVNSRLLGYSMDCKAGEDYSISFRFTMELGPGNYWINLTSHTGYSHLERCFFSLRKVIPFTVGEFLGIPFEGMVRLLPEIELPSDHLGAESYLKPIRSEANSVKVLCPFSEPVVDTRGAVEALDEISSLEAGVRIAVPLKVVNESSVDWASTPMDGVFVAYIWTAMGNEGPQKEGLRTPFPDGVLASGRSATLFAMVQPPAEQGRYDLHFSVVQENVGWFHDRALRSTHLAIDIK